MHWTTLGAFAGLELLLCFIPGPAVMAVVGAALCRGRIGLATACGILTGNLIYFIVSALGIASVLLASHEAFTVVKWCGAAYLAYLGARTFAARDPRMLAAAQSSSQDRLLRGWAGGVITQLANPKALIFFGAIVPQFIDPHANLGLQMAVLGIISLVVEFSVLSAYIAGAKRIRRSASAPATAAWAERLGGVCLLGVAAAVVRERP